MSLAVWRISHFFADDNEDGPFDIAHIIRRKLGVRYDAYNTMYGTSAISKMVLCVWCSSFWFGAVAAVAYALLWRDWKEALWLPLATSAFSVIVETWVNRGQ